MAFYTVTPCMGVWIETLRLFNENNLVVVTPCMGVWIETSACGTSAEIFSKSHPVWVCGLKLAASTWESTGTRVTPCMGVWIETYTDAVITLNMTSHPVWVCGLKQIFALVAKFEKCHTLYGCVD